MKLPDSLLLKFVHYGKDYNYPDGVRWTEYSNIGEIIVGTPFVAFKTPLSQRYDGRLPVEKRFSPSMLSELHPNLSVVVDLTATDRYYHCYDIKQLGMDHIKIKVPGRILPPQELVARFFEVADNYRAINESGSKDKIIGVHCTHGLNRTGYFVCRYLIERMGFSPQDAINKFQDARGHKMERSNYIEDLHSCIPSSHPPKEWDSKNNSNSHSPPLNGRFNWGLGCPRYESRDRQDSEKWYLDDFSPTTRDRDRRGAAAEPRSRNSSSSSRWNPERPHQYESRRPNLAQWDRRNADGFSPYRPGNTSPRDWDRRNQETSNRGSRHNGFWPSSQNRQKHSDYLQYAWRKREDQ